MSEHPNVERARAAYRAFTEGNLAHLEEVLADDVVLHVPGRNPLAGRYEGKAGFFAFLGRLAALTGGGFRSELVDVLANDNHAVVLGRAEADRDGESYRGGGGVIFRLRDGLVAEARLFHEDQYAVDRFWSGDQA